jgi:periplasmic divalent cation tolerance protein
LLIKKIKRCGWGALNERVTMPSQYSVVFVTVANEGEAQSIALTLVEDSLAACVGMIPQKSIYSWKGKIVEDTEVLLIIKTKNELFKGLKEAILKAHSYEVPEVIRIEIQEGHQPYLQWIEEVVKTSR